MAAATTKQQKKIKVNTKGVNFLTASKVREAFKGAGLRVSGEFIDEFNGFVGEQIEKAAVRAQSNGRQTVRGTDI